MTLKQERYIYLHNVAECKFKVAKNLNTHITYKSLKGIVLVVASEAHVSGGGDDVHLSTFQQPDFTVDRPDGHVIKITSSGLAVETSRDHTRFSMS